MKILIIANSSVQDISINSSKYDAIIVLDGAGNYVKQSFDYLIGDLDSLEIAHREAYKDKIIHIPEQSSTDLHKGIKYADKLGATEIDIINALGGRIDHTMLNIRTLKMLHSNLRRMRILDTSQSLEFYQDCEILLHGKIGDHIGILAAPSAVITSAGLKYNMNNTKLEWGIAESSSNSFESDQAKISVQGGILVNLYI